jgi:hypothetical protein
MKEEQKVKINFQGKRICLKIKSSLASRELSLKMIHANEKKYF